MTSLEKHPEAAQALCEGRPWALEMFGGVADGETDNMPALGACAQATQERK